MSRPIDRFQHNIAIARHLMGLSSTLDSQTTDALDTSDILRASLVMAVSAWDHYVHEVVQEGVVEIYLGTRPETDSYSRFPVSLAGVRQSQDDLHATAWLEEAVRHKHGHRAFQQPDQVADACRLVSDTPLWPTLSAELRVPTWTLKIRLKLIVDRRNKIAHEADIDPSDPPLRWPITTKTVDDAISFFESIAAAIDRLLISERSL